MKIALIALGATGAAGTYAWQCDTIRGWLECCCEAVCHWLGIA